MDNATLTKHAEAILRALDDADRGHGLRLIRLVDGEETYAVTVGDKSAEINGQDEAYEWLAREKFTCRQQAILTALRAAVEDGAERDAQKASDEAADFCITTLASMLGNPDYEQCDGTEEWEGDVAGTIFNVLRAADVLDENHRVATHSVPKWLSLDSAPYSTPVRIKCGGMTFIAELLKDVGMTEDEESCDGWQAVNEGEHPPCWSDGMCWSSNENEDPSIPPEAWQPLDPTTISATVGGGA